MVGDLPNSAKLWVYQSSRSFTPIEKEEISQKGLLFVRDWASHGSKLTAAFEIVYDRFLVLAVDETQMKASGCSIDSSVGFVKEIERTYNVNLFDRLAVAFYKGEEIHVLPLTEFESLIDNRIVSPETIVFNNLVSTVGEFKSHWQVRAKNSWLARYF
ncbi:MAG: ABC transporter ATPase [Flavobacteriales bacterium]